MWTRAGLKEKAKNALRANYWRTIVVTLIVFLIGGASTGVNFNVDSDDISSFFEEGFSTDMLDDNTTLEEFGAGLFSDEFMLEDDEFYKEFPDEFSEEFSDTQEMLGFAVSIFFIILVVGIVIATIIGFVLTVFVFCPIEVGTDRFFFKNLNKPAEIKEVVFAFDNNYKNIVKVLFFRELYLLGWSLLFVIPGIIKSYEYLMVPYLLAENPNLTKEEAFRLSKQMMMGHKWDAFVLGLSFIGWDILSGFTFGILSIFYVQPYKCLTFAALYEELSLINGRPARAFEKDAYMGMNTYDDGMSAQMYYEPVEDTMNEGYENM